MCKVQQNNEIVYFLFLFFRFCDARYTLSYYFKITFVILFLFLNFRKQTIHSGVEQLKKRVTGWIITRRLQVGEEGEKKCASEKLSSCSWLAKARPGFIYNQLNLDHAWDRIALGGWAVPRYGLVAIGRNVAQSCRTIQPDTRGPSATYDVVVTRQFILSPRRNTIK